MLTDNSLKLYRLIPYDNLLCCEIKFHLFGLMTVMTGTVRAVSPLLSCGFSSLIVMPRDAGTE